MLNKNLIQDFFKVSISLKGIFALLESLLGILLFFITSNLLLKIIYLIFGHELAQDPTDFFVNFLLNIFSNFPVNLKTFFAIYLLTHGIIKLGLIVALFKKRLWAYPTSQVVFLLFAFYQIYGFLRGSSFFLIILTLIDIIVIISIHLKYKILKHRKLN